MVAMSSPGLGLISLVEMHKPHHHPHFSGTPVIDMSRPESKTVLVKACEELGFFKVINHGVPLEAIAAVEAEAVKFFSLSQLEKEKVGIASPYGYRSKTIGRNGDVGWVEYLLIQVKSNNSKPNSSFGFLSGLTPSDRLCWALDEYVRAVRKVTCDVLEMMADGLGICRRDVFSKLVMEEESDTVFRLNHYPPHPLLFHGMDCEIIGFGEHTDPQIISVLGSNNTSGLQISLKDGTWVSVPPDQHSFFVNVGDSLQVLTNGRFKSVKHRVLANGLKSRVSMIYFGGPPLGERIAPLNLLMGEGEESQYRDFTWFDYKVSAYKTRLAHNRLAMFLK